MDKLGLEKLKKKLEKLKKNLEKDFFDDANELMTWNNLKKLTKDTLEKNDVIFIDELIDGVGYEITKYKLDK